MSRGEVAVIICSWAAGEDMVFDPEALAEYAAGLPGVARARVVRRICTRPGEDEAVVFLRDSGADRSVIVACSPRTKGALHARIAERSGLDRFAVEAVDVREGAAYVHAPGPALEKARTSVAMAVGKMLLWAPPPHRILEPASRRVAVVGDGLSAALAARELLDQGLEVDILLSEEDLRGPPRCLFIGESEAERARRTMTSAAERARVIRSTTARCCEGGPGGLELVSEGPGGPSVETYGAVVLAPEPDLELRDLRGEPVSAADAVGRGARSVVVLPGGKSSGTGCSCITPRGMAFALEALRSCPGMRVALLGREVRALGGMEALQRQAQAAGVMFYRLDGEPELKGDPPSKLVLHDPLLGRTELEADLFLVDSVSVPRAEILARAFGLPQDERGELLSIESRLRPGETVRTGVFACRHRVGNMVLEDLEREAATVAARAGELLRGEVVLGGMVAEVDQERCSACLSCVRICPYSAPRIGAKGKAEVLLERCQGCGACAPLCPSQAIRIHLCSDAQLGAQIGIVTRGPA